MAQCGKVPNDFRKVNGTVVKSLLKIFFYGVLDKSSSPSVRGKNPFKGNFIDLQG